MSGASIPARSARSEGRSSLGFGWPPLIALGLCSAIAVVGLTPGRDAPPSHVVERVSLHFARDAQGDLLVRDGSGALRGTIPGSGDNFVRGVWHTLQTVRARYGVPPAAPFELVKHSDGRLVLLDPGTHSTIDIESFGSTNDAAFAALLPDAGAGAGRAR